jgi:hypothetical protein
MVTGPIPSNRPGRTLTTRGWTQTTDQTSDTAELGSAEVIAEAPSSGTGTVPPLSDFGTVSFTGVTVDGTGTAPTPTPTGTATAPGTGGRPGRHHHHHGFGG